MFLPLWTDRTETSFYPGIPRKSGDPGEPLRHRLRDFRGLFPYGRLPLSDRLCALICRDGTCERSSYHRTSGSTKRMDRATPGVRVMNPRRSRATIIWWAEGGATRKWLESVASEGATRYCSLPLHRSSLSLLTPPAWRRRSSGRKIPPEEPLRRSPATARPPRERRPLKPAGSTGGYGSW